MTKPLSTSAAGLRRSLLPLCADLAAAGGAPAALDLMPADTGTDAKLTSEEVRQAVVDVWEVLCRDDRRWSFPEKLSLRCPDGQVLHLTADDLPEFPTDTQDATGRDVGYALAAHRAGVSIVPVPADAFPGRRAPSALLRRGPDDIGTYAVFSTAGPDVERITGVTELILDAADRLRDVGGGEVVVDARGGEPFTSAEAYRGYLGALRAAKEEASGRLPSAVTVVLDSSSVRLETPELLRGVPPVNLLIVPPRPDVAVGEVLDTLRRLLRGELVEHRGQAGVTLTVQGSPGRDYPTRLVWTVEDELPGALLPVRLRVRSGDERFSPRDAIAIADFVHRQRGWRVGVTIGGRTVVHHAPREGVSR